MKLFTKKPPKEGERRYRKAFAFLPTKVYDRANSSYEWIWLEQYLSWEEYTIDWSSWSAETRWKVNGRFLNN